MGNCIGNGNVSGNGNNPKIPTEIKIIQTSDEVKLSPPPNETSKQRKKEVNNALNSLEKVDAAARWGFDSGDGNRERLPGSYSPNTAKGHIDVSYSKDSVTGKLSKTFEQGKSYVKDVMNKRAESQSNGIQR